MAKDLKEQKQISIRPSVRKKGEKLIKKVGATSFSDMLEKLILKEFGNE